jgi:hypothetical protein
MNKPKLGRWYMSDKGLPAISFTDQNYKECSVEMATLCLEEQASAEDRILLGVNGHRMELNREQVDALQWVLETWICEGGKK